MGRVVVLKIRSVTVFLPVSETLGGGPDAGLARAARLCAAARESAPGAGIALQSTRLAVQPLARILRSVPALEFGRAFERVYGELGFDYGALLLSAPELYAHAAALVQSTTTLFVSLAIASRGQRVNVPAIRAAAAAIHALAHDGAGGLSNFRFAAAGNVPPGVPFFPTAFAAEEEASFAFATEAADLAVEAFTGAATLDEAGDRLGRAVERHGARLDAWGRELEAACGLRYAGIDFSLAPFPEENASLGTALERLTGARFGTRGTLFAASFVTDTLKQARFTRAGFSSLMLPLLEDWTMALRSHEDLFTLDSLLLYSTVCGTGLDTIPLAGDTDEHALGALLLDLAALAVKLDKPLTARLVPVPGVAAGEATHFEFTYFANAHAFGLHADRGFRLPE